MLNLLIIVFLCNFGSSKDDFNSQTVKVSNYELTIILDNDSFENNKFKGRVSISLEPLDDKTSIYINCLNITIEDVQLFKENQEIKYDKTKYHLEEDSVELIFNEKLEPRQKHTLTISYSGILNDFPRGIYKSWYVDEHGKKHYFVVTYFEPTWASRAFPCFDMPHMKAHFTQHLIHPDTHKSWSNEQSVSTEALPNNLVNTSFKTTPPMSTFSVAFVVAEFKCRSLNTHSEIRACSRPQARRDLIYALDIGAKLMSVLEKIINSSYKSLGIEKLDMIAIPNFIIDYDFRGRGMGNWGLATFSEDTLLYNIYSSSMLNKQRIAASIAYQMASMWFGNAITAYSWSYNVLNVGFATFYGQLALTTVKTQWNFEQQFVIDRIHSVLRLDVQQLLPALSLEANSLEDFRQKSVWTTSHVKGASVVRMLCYALGCDKFKSYIQSYVNDSKWSAVTWSHIYSRSGVRTKIDGFCDKWTELTGYPLLLVFLKGNDVIIKQEDVGNEYNTYYWYIPITFTTQNKGNFLNTSLTAMFTPFTENVRLENVIQNESDWIIVNIQQISYCRILYDLHLWKRIINVLKTRPDIVHPLNKAQIVDDLFNLAYLDRIPHPQLWEYLDFLRNDLDYFPWKAAFTNFEILLCRIYDRGIYTKLLKYIENLMENLLLVPYKKFENPNHVLKLQHLEVFKWSCILEQKSSIDFVQHAFNLFRKGFKVSPDVTSIVLCSILRSGDHIEMDFDFLWNQYKNSTTPSEKSIILESLTCVHNSKLLERYLHWIITDTEVPKQNMLLLLDLIAIHIDSVDTVRNFIVKNFQKIVDNCYENLVYVYLPRVLSKYFRRKHHIAELKGIMSGQLSTRARNTLTEVIAAAEKILIDLEHFEYIVERDLSYSWAGNAMYQTKFTTITFLCLILLIK